MCLAPGLLFTEENVLGIGNSGELTLECTLAGYVEELTINEDLIDWTFNGQPLITDSNYFISVGSRECSPYGICGLGFLRIVDVDSDDLGDYVCLFGDLSQTITLIEGHLLIRQLSHTYIMYIYISAAAVTQAYKVWYFFYIKVYIHLLPGIITFCKMK